MLLGVQSYGSIPYARADLLLPPTSSSSASSLPSNEDVCPVNQTHDGSLGGMDEPCPPGMAFCNAQVPIGPASCQQLTDDVTVEILDEETRVFGLYDSNWNRVGSIVALGHGRVRKTNRVNGYVVGTSISYIVGEPNGAIETTNQFFYMINSVIHYDGRLRNLAPSRNYHVTTLPTPPDSVSQFYRITVFR